MRYWTRVSPLDKSGTHFYETLSEDEIIAEYWDYWSERMIAKYGKEEFEKTWSRQECIEDWITLHWATESIE